MFLVKPVVLDIISVSLFLVFFLPILHNNIKLTRNEEEVSARLLACLIFVNIQRVSTKFRCVIQC
jgi:hypothetical protein